MEDGAMDARAGNDLKTYTPEEAARILKVTRRTLYSYLASGALRSAKLGRIWRITPRDIEEFLAERRPSAEAARSSRTAGPSA